MVEAMEQAVNMPRTCSMSRYVDCSCISAHYSLYEIWIQSWYCWM